VELIIPVAGAGVGDRHSAGFFSSTEAVILTRLAIEYRFLTMTATPSDEPALDQV